MKQTKNNKMIPSDICLYSQITALLTSEYQRGVLQQEIEIGTKIHNQILCTKSLNWRSLSPFSPQSLRTPGLRRKKDSRSWVGE